MVCLIRIVALVGMMGAGKSSIGRRLASRLDVPFCDSDTEIELAAGCTINEIFERFGEAAFRDGERRVLARLLNDEPKILATGGGAFATEEIRNDIRTKAFSVWIKAPVDVLLTRVQRRDTRPLLKTGDPKETLERLIREREEIYGQADLVISSSDGPHGVAVERIIAGLHERGILQ
jgi:shikimate kinase